MPSLAEHAQSIAEAYQPPPTGRPSDIGSPSTIQQFLEAVGEGNYIETSAKLAGISKGALYNWIKRGQAGEDAFAQFVDALEKAEARAEAHLVSLQRKAAEAGPQYWPAAATQLERRHPDRWGKRQESDSGPKVVVNIGVGATDVQVTVVSPPTFAPDSPLEDSANVLTSKAFALDSSPITAVMVTHEDACQEAKAIGESRQANPQGDPTPAVGAEESPRMAVPVKGRRGLARKKKGQA